MTMDFHDSNNSESYTSREADDSWLRFMRSKISVIGTKAADIGCGGGIYTKALAKLVGAQVTGIDFSRAMLNGAAANCAGYADIHFQQGHALNTGLPGASFGVVLQRALIHHLTGGELADCFGEAYRIIHRGGTLIVQDRTPEDCLLSGGKEHLRGYFFEKFPKLIPKETARRHTSEAVCRALAEAGFVQVESAALWETRKSITSFSEFCRDLRNRTGRTILHELNDAELEELEAYIRKQTGYEDQDIMEDKDRWTVWFARKH